MSYVALARKWRPREFDQLVGQEHVLRALATALNTGRVHHAFLFTGTRGVGKTTIARIFAKSLNCEKGVGSHPCGECSACVEIDQGRFVDLLEVDAASRTKVDDTRELLDNVQYLPARGRFKVYLVDEVHMLSNNSFNALLKTLEEPPAHVKFLLATTDPQKLPVTVLSRCLQFNLKRLSVTLIRERLAFIVGEEKIASESAALELVARAANGSLRDALSLLDQLIVFGGGKITEADARLMLGTIDRSHIVRLLERVAERDAAGVLREIDQLDESSPDYAAALDGLASLIQKVALRQAVSEYSAGELFDPGTLDDLARRIGAQELQLYYQMALLGRRDLDLAADSRGGFEMVLLRMLAFTLESASGVAAGIAASGKTKNESRPSGGAAKASAFSASPGVDPGTDWAAILTALDVDGLAYNLAANCGLVSREGDAFRLALDPRFAPYLNPQNESIVREALSRLLGRPAALKIEMGDRSPDTPARQQSRAADARTDAARDALVNDPTVRALQDTFGATLVPDSIKPLN